MINLTPQHKLSAQLGHNDAPNSSILTTGFLVALALVDGTENTFSNVLFDAPCKTFLQVLKNSGAKVQTVAKTCGSQSVVDIFVSKGHFGAINADLSGVDGQLALLAALIPLALTTPAKHCFCGLSHANKEAVSALVQTAIICRQNASFDGKNLTVESDGKLLQKPIFFSGNFAEVALCQAILCLGACGGGSIDGDCFEKHFPAFLPSVGVAPIKLGLLGCDITQSKSPLLMRCLARNANVCCRYTLFQLPADADDLTLQDTLQNLDGANITMPFKNRVAQLFGGQGSVNTVGKNILPTSTDGYGIVQSLINNGVDICGPLWIVGAGGAAEACICQLKNYNVQMQVINRTTQHAALLTQKYSLAENITQPVGILSFVPQCQFEQDLPLPSSVKFVLVAAYKGASGLADKARARNLLCIDGLEMLYHQGAQSFALWTGTEVQNNYLQFLEANNENTFA